jgi:hypothetical protein
MGCTACPRRACPRCGRVDCASAVDPVCVECDAFENRNHRAQLSGERREVTPWASFGGWLEVGLVLDDRAPARRGRRVA